MLNHKTQHMNASTSQKSFASFHQVKNGNINVGKNAVNVRSIRLTLKTRRLPNVLPDVGTTLYLDLDIQTATRPNG